MENQALPSSEKIEKSVLSNIIQDPTERIDEFIEFGCKIDDFYKPAHREFFKLVQRVLGDGGNFNLVEFHQKAEEVGVSTKMGGASFITEIFTYQPTSAHYERNCKLLMDYSMRRALILRSMEIQARAYSMDSDEGAEEITNAAESMMWSIRDERCNDAEFWSMLKLTKRAAARYQELWTNRDDNKHGIKTGFPSLDYMTGGLKAGSLYVVAARPSMGKTSIVANMMEEIAIDNSMPVDFYSIEMSKDSVYDRFVAQRANANLSNILNGGTTNGEQKAIRRVLADYKTSNLQIIEDSSITASQILSKARRRKKRLGTRAIFVDYLQIIKADDAVERGDLRILCQNALQKMKQVAKECEIPVVVLTQLNRDADGKPAQDHSFSNLKDCGNIEQDADVILTIGNAASDQDETQPVVNRVINVLKNRQGAKGLIDVKFIKESTKFYE